MLASTAKFRGQEAISPTTRELEVIDLLLDGHTNESIALQMDISIETVRRHVYNVFQKEGVNTRLDFATRILKRRHAAEIALIHQQYQEKK